MLGHESRDAKLEVERSAVVPGATRSTEKMRVVFGMMLAVVVVAVLALGLAATALAAEGELTSEQRAAAADIEGKLIAPCCWTQTVEVHDSQKAEEIKMQVALMVSQGKGEDEILDVFVAQYGEEILAAPRASGFNWLAYVLPFATIVVGLGAISVLASRWRASRPAAAPVPASIARDGGDDTMAHRLDEELTRFDQ